MAAVELLDKHEHWSCFNYEKGRNPQIEAFRRSAGESIEHQVSDTELLILTHGSFRLSYANLIRETVTAGKIMLFTPGSRFGIETEEDCHYFVFRIKGFVQLCECMSLERLHREAGDVPKGFHMLDANERIFTFIGLLEECMDDGMKCTYYLRNKVTELLFMLRGYYAKEQIARLFSPMLSNDAQFMLLMYENYGKAYTVKELANMSNYSLSGFKKQFNRVFGMSPSEWVTTQKAAQIYRDLNLSNTPIKDLVEKYHFSSPSSFSKFCHQKFGLPPGQIKQNALKAGGG